MTIRGRPIETTFTPASNGVVRVSVKFRLVWDLAACFGGAFCEQGGVTTYGIFLGPPKFVNQAFTAQGTFAVTAGTLVKVGLAADSGSPYRMSFYELEVNAEFIPN